MEPRRRIVRIVRAADAVMQEQRLWPVSLALAALGGYSLFTILRHADFAAERYQQARVRSEHQETEAISALDFRERRR